MVLLTLSFVLLLTAHPLGPPSQPASQTHQTVRDPQLYCSCPHSLLAHHQTSSSSISFASIPRSIITTSYHSSDPCRLSNRERKGMHHPLNAFSPILAPRPASSAPSPDAPRLAGRDRHTPTCLNAHRSTSESTAHCSVAIHTPPDNRRSAAFARCCTLSSALNNPFIPLGKLAGIIQTRLIPCELATNITKSNDRTATHLDLVRGWFCCQPSFRAALQRSLSLIPINQPTSLAHESYRAPGLTCLLVLRTP